MKIKDVSCLDLETRVELKAQKVRIKFAKSLEELQEILRDSESKQ